MDIFIYDNTTNKLKLNNHSILLVKEFAELCSEKRKKSFNEMTYIYLMLDWKSPYFNYLEKDRHEAALIDSNLNEKDLKDPVFINAINKYSEILESDRILSLIKTALRTLTKIQVYLDGIDFNLDVDENGKPIHKPKAVIDDIASIGKMRNQLLELEVEHKKGLKAASKVRGDNEPGFGDV